MGYHIEVSFHLGKHPNVTEYEEEVCKLAKQYSCDDYYRMNEFEEHKAQQRNHSVINAHFENVISFTEFIKKIKEIQGIYIETIYNDDIRCELLYASQYYLTIMDKNGSKMYKKQRRERSYSEDETMILKEVTTKTPHYLHL